MNNNHTLFETNVAPLAGARIETAARRSIVSSSASLPSRERELKPSHAKRKSSGNASLPSRERELKRRRDHRRYMQGRSLPSRERELKLIIY